MVKIEHSSSNRGTLYDKLFTLAINIIQSTIVKERVRSKINEYSKRSGPRADDNFFLQLRELGLSPETLWWGPMTLFPRKAQFLLGEIEKQPPSRLLEVGSGTSTSLFAALAVKYNFSMLSLENYEDTINYVQTALEQLPCSNHVILQKCAFIRGRYKNGEKYRWYDAELYKEKGLFDFVFIDGPMSSIVGRNGALPEIISYLSKNHRIYIDDYNRKHEQQCVSEWKRHYPNLIIETFNECRGIARLSLPIA